MLDKRSRVSRHDIAGWFDRGVDSGNAWMVIVSDAGDEETYPSYHITEESARKAVAEPGRMERVVEVYKLDPRYRDYQIGLRCCWGFNIEFNPDAKQGAV